MSGGSVSNFVRIVFVAVFLALSATAIVKAAPSPTPSPVPTAAPPETASETQFVSPATSDLQSRFATTTAAAAAGYFQYTDEDQTGAISWVNTSNWASDPQHPSQLWYDVQGHLIGADFSVLQSTSKDRPTFGRIAFALHRLLAGTRALRRQDGVGNSVSAVSAKRRWQW